MHIYVNLYVISPFLISKSFSISGKFQFIIVLQKGYVIAKNVLNRTNTADTAVPCQGKQWNCFMSSNKSLL